MSPNRTTVYVDGFNLYYGCLKGSPYRWINLEALFKTVLPQESVVQIRYFTARVSGKVDPQAPLRQQIYLRALATLPSVSIHYGTFLTNKTWMPLATPPLKGSRKVQVIKTEEKGSDVNLACWMLLDGFKGRTETAVVVSNDSDLEEPVIVARSELGLRVGVLNPHPRHKRSRVLSRDAHFVKEIPGSALAACQFPATLIDSHGTFGKPAKW
jgi:hypothetical protein